jgi:hypothetical protein
LKSRQLSVCDAGKVTFEAMSLRGRPEYLARVRLVSVLRVSCAEDAIVCLRAKE